MKILIDMNLSPEWVDLLRESGFQAIHWSSIGKPSASDSEIMAWAAANAHIVFTHDLDFGTALALAGASGPSVFQVRIQDVLPKATGGMVVGLLKRFAAELEKGAIVTAEPNRLRVRLLPVARRSE